MTWLVSFLYLFRTPLHCAASMNNAVLCKALVEAGAAVLATTYSDHQTPADKCDPMAAGFQQCAQFMYGAYREHAFVLKPRDTRALIE